MLDTKNHTKKLTKFTKILNYIKSSCIIFWSGGIETFWSGSIETFLTQKSFKKNQQVIINNL